MKLKFLNKGSKVSSYLIIVLIISVILAFFRLPFILLAFLGLNSIYLGRLINGLIDEKNLNENNIENLSINIPYKNESYYLELPFSHKLHKLIFLPLFFDNTFYHILTLYLVLFL